MGPDSGAHDAWNDYLQRYADWTQDATRNEFTQTIFVDPYLVKEIYEWNTSGISLPELLGLNPAAKTLDPIAAPHELAPLLSRLQANSSSVQAAMEAWRFGKAPQAPSETTGTRSTMSRMNPLAGWQLDDRVPALVHAILHHTNPFNSLTPVDRARVDWLLVV